MYESNSISFYIIYIEGDFNLKRKMIFQDEASNARQYDVSAILKCEIKYNKAQ